LIFICYYIYSCQSLLTSYETHMDVYSLAESWYDIIQEVGKELSKNSEKAIGKIVSQMNNFIQYQVVDGRLIKHLDWNIFECRVSAPLSKDLVRVLFSWERDKLVLLSSYFIKPKLYDDTWTQKQIDAICNQKISISKEVLKDFLGQQNKNYVDITKYFTNI